MHRHSSEIASTSIRLSTLSMPPQAEQSSGVRGEEDLV
jgi:hypothetical protein